MRSTLFYVLSLSLILFGCGGNDDSAIDASISSDASPTTDSGASPDANSETWQPLVSGNWDMPPGQEGYTCVRHTVTEDIYVKKFRAISPVGTHHTVLTVGNPVDPDGITSCSASTNANAMIYGSGVGTNPIELPKGVAMKIAKGQQLLLNLHLFNVSDDLLEGTSGTEIVTIPENEVEHTAEVILMGKVLGLTVPPGESTQEGTCRMNGDVTIFAVGPHMHQQGSHMKVVAERDASDPVTLHDGAYDFYEQKIFPLGEPIEMKNGDKIKVYCTYNNTTGETLRFGDSSNQEMCFAGIYRYPAHGGTLSNIVCAN